MSDPSASESRLDPRLRAKLLQESKTPWRGLRRGLWIAFSGSSLIGLLIMSLRGLAGDSVPLGDLTIQVIAVLLFSFLLFWDRKREES